MSEALWSLKWEKGELVLLDQTKLPGSISYIHCRESREVGEAISRLSVRGAPAIGVAAAYGMVLAFKEIKKEGLTGPSLKGCFPQGGQGACCCSSYGSEPVLGCQGNGSYL